MKYTYAISYSMTFQQLNDSDWMCINDETARHNFGDVVDYSELEDDSVIFEEEDNCEAMTDPYDLREFTETAFNTYYTDRDNGGFKYCN